MKPLVNSQITMNLPIYPEYNFRHAKIKTETGIQNAYYFGCNVRKQGSDGKWFLIPVVKRFEAKKETRDILNMIIKEFHDDCYRVLLFFQISEDSANLRSELEPWIKIGGELDESQVSEEERLKIGKYREDAVQKV